MNIKILPYIEPETLQPNIAPTANPSETVNTVGNFADNLALAQRTLEALAVDLVASQDTQVIEQAAAILKSSRITELQNIGKQMLGETTGEASASGSQTMASTPTTAANNDTDTTQTNTKTVSPDGTRNTFSVSSTTDSSQTVSDTDTKAADQTTASKSAAQVDTNSKTTGSDKTSLSSATKKAASALGCPSSLRKYFEKAAKKYNVDVALLMSIAKAESDFQTDCVSSAGATGVMQIMPSTAKDLGVSDLYDPEDNIMGGAKEISGNLDRYDGDLTLALAGYNAGNGNVRKYGGVPPFKETRNYIKKVTAYYNKSKS